MRKPIGFTITELLVVLFIISVLAGIMVPAIQYVRTSARESVCQSNVRQLGMALTNWQTGKKKLPQYNNPYHSGGWVTAVLPFVDLNYSFEVYEGIPFDTPTSAARNRHPTFTCPLAPNAPRLYENIDRTHYILIGDFSNWYIMDAPVTDRSPWIAGNRWDQLRVYENGPHRNGYYRYLRQGGVEYVRFTGETN